MKRRTFLALVPGSLLAAPLAAEAQPTGKVFRVGFLLSGPMSERAHLVEAFRQGLSDLGYVEGQNIALVLRSQERGGKRLADLAVELVGLKVDLIVAGGLLAIQAAKDATRTIPIVMGASPDPVEMGFVASLARPGGNVTGLSRMAPELGGKRLRLLKEVVPGASRVAVLSNPNPGSARVVREMEAAARVVGVQLQLLEIRAPEEIDRAFEGAIGGRASGLIVVEDPLVLSHRARIVALAAKSRLPAIYPFREVVEAGGLMSYAANLSDDFRRAATFVDKILKGAKPGDLPVEQPTKFELVINLKTAKALGLTIPQTLLLQADQVLE